MSHTPHYTIVKHHPSWELWMFFIIGCFTGVGFIIWIFLLATQKEYKVCSICGVAQDKHSSTESVLIKETESAIDLAAKAEFRNKEVIVKTTSSTKFPSKFVSKWYDIGELKITPYRISTDDTGEYHHYTQGQIDDAIKRLDDIERKQLEDEENKRRQQRYDAEIFNERIKQNLHAQKALALQIELEERSRRIRKERWDSFWNWFKSDM